MDSAFGKAWTVLSLTVFLLVLIPGIDHGLWRPDEPRVAGTCAEMARTGDYVVPHLNGVPFLEKPPLYYAAGALSGSFLGIDSDVPYRLVSLLFSLLTVITLYAAVTRREGKTTGLMAAGILSSTWGFFMLARWVQVDMALVFGFTLAMYAYLKADDGLKATDAMVFGLAAGTAFMAKGLVGPAMIAAAVMIDIIRRRDLRCIWKIRPFVIMISAALVTVPWIMALWNRGGWPFLREVLVVNNLMRFTGAPEGAALGHQHGFLYYLAQFPEDFLPWTLLFIPALIASFRRFRQDPYISWFVGPFLLLFLSSTKRGLYLVPFFPAAAAMTAIWLSRASFAKWEGVLFRITWGVAALGCFLPFAGIYLGMPVLGLSMGILAMSLLALISLLGEEKMEGLCLVLVMCIGLGTCMTVYFSYLKPQEDFLGIARQVIAQAEGQEITILAGNETMEGVLPLITGKRYKMVDSPDEVRDAGIYVWLDKNNRIMESLTKHADVKILLQKKLDFWGKKKVWLVRVTDVVPYAGEKGAHVAGDKARESTVKKDG